MSTTTTEATAPPAKKSKKLIFIVVGLVAVIGAGYVVVLPKISKPAAAASKSAATKPKASQKPGAVLKEDSITLNLAGGHYLRLGLALQLPAGVAETDVDGSKALNIAIEMLSGDSVSKLTGTRGRTAIASLDKAIVSAYGSDVVSSVYLTDFVMQ